MIELTHYPVVLFAISLVAMLSAACGGMLVLRQTYRLEGDLREDFTVILGSNLTLLGLLIAFSFSMAVTRYDQRKRYEAVEANAIRAEYMRAGLLTPPQADQLRRLLEKYLNQRLLFHTVDDDQALNDIESTTVELQDSIWNLISDAAQAPQAVPAIGQLVSGMTDIVSSQGDTRAAFLNHVPVEVWLLLTIIATSGNALLGYGARRARDARGGRLLLMVVPVTVSLSLFLIADIDSPHGGFVRVSADNLRSVAASIRRP